MIIRVILGLLAVCAVGLALVWLHEPESTALMTESVHEEIEVGNEVTIPLPASDRQERLELAVNGFFAAETAEGRLPFVRRRSFVDADLDESFGEPLEIDEVGELVRAGTTLTMVRVKFTDGYVSLLLEELVSGRFLVDFETANPGEPEAWQKFRQTRATTSQAFRVYGTLSDYYNYGFDRSTHVALEIKVPGCEDIVTGYISRALTGTMRLLEAVEGQIAVPLILSLSHPEPLEDPSQVKIEGLVQSDWVILDDAVAPTFGESGLVSR